MVARFLWLGGDDDRRLKRAEAEFEREAVAIFLLRLLKMDDFGGDSFSSAVGDAIGNGDLRFFLFCIFPRGQRFGFQLWPFNYESLNDSIINSSISSGGFLFFSNYIWIWILLKMELKSLFSF